MGDRLGDEQQQNHAEADHTFDQEGAVNLGFKENVLDLLDQQLNGEELDQVIVDGFEALPMGSPEIAHHAHGGKRHGNKQIADELVEGQPHLGADDDIGGVSHQGGRAAQVGGHGQRDHVNARIQAHAARQLDNDGHHDQHGGDIVQKGRNHRCHGTEENQDTQGLATGHLGDTHRDHGKEAGFFQHRHDAHHPDEQHDGLIVDGTCRGVLVDDAQDQQGHHPEQGRNGLVHPLEGDERIHDDKNSDGNPCIRPHGVTPNYQMGWFRTLSARGNTAMLRNGPR
ncbi:hypothetical protein DESC_690074 [Desulfosarcina cetonica]|nr:hypothetical protein DESC_690074 [Desulfosarcina cetonica]